MDRESKAFRRRVCLVAKRSEQHRRKNRRRAQNLRRNPQNPPEAAP